ncbi:MAG: tetratricopeptide repeat protein [Mangrovibacterium sp.]
MRSTFLLIMSFIVNMASAQLNINNYIQAGQTRLQVGNYVGAIEHFNIVIKFKPQLPEPYFLRGLAKHQLEDFRGAIADYDVAINIKPYFPDAYSSRGLARLELQDFEGAIADYNKALELAPRDAGIYNNRGIARISMKNVEGAIADYNKALKFNPNFINAYINRSNAYIVKGEIREAIRDLNRVVMIRPHYGQVYLLRGLARFQLDDYAAALRDFDQTLRFDPQNAYAYNNRGIVKQELGDYVGAIMDYDLALQLNPTLPNAYFNRGIAREILNRPGSENDFHVAARLDPKLDIRRFRKEQQAEQYARQQQQQQQQILAANSGGQGNSASGSASPSAQKHPAQQQIARADSTAQQQTGKQQTVQDKEQQERRRFRLALADTRNLPQYDEAEEAENGLIQNRNVIIELQRIFVISSFSEKEMDYRRLQYYSMALEELNRKNNYSPLMSITNQDMENYTENFKNQLNYFTDRLETEKSSVNYLCRGIFLYLIFDYNKALDDLDQSLRKDRANMLTWFTRANARLKMAELIESVPDYSDELIVPVGSKGQAAETKTKEILLDYQYVMEDYRKATQLDPAFPFSWYNRAYVLSKLKRFDEAMDDLDRAIALQPDFAEAYFNRGLIKIYQNDTEGGALDLSKAGDLGIKAAYNVIKRYCN